MLMMMGELLRWDQSCAAAAAAAWACWLEARGVYSNIVHGRDPEEA